MPDFPTCANALLKASLSIDGVEAAVDQINYWDVAGHTAHPTNVFRQTLILYAKAKGERLWQLRAPLPQHGKTTTETKSLCGACPTSRLNC